MSNEIFTLDAAKRTAHITPARLGQFNRASLGIGDLVFDYGKNFEAQIIDNNTVRIYDGIISQDGIRGGIETGAYVDAIIENGTQDMRRKDIISFRWQVNVEDPFITEQIVTTIKGTPTTDATAVAPAVITDLIHEGAMMHDTALYEVELDGLNIKAVTQLFVITPTIKELADELATTNNDLSKIISKFSAIQETYGDNGQGVPLVIATRINNLVTVELNCIGQGGVFVALSEPFRPKSKIERLYWSNVEISKSASVTYTIDTNGELTANNTIYRAHVELKYIV